MLGFAPSGKTVFNVSGSRQGYKQSFTVISADSNKNKIEQAAQTHFDKSLPGRGPITIEVVWGSTPKTLTKINEATMKSFADKILKESQFGSYADRQNAVNAKNTEIYNFIKAQLSGLSCHMTASLPQGCQFSIGMPTKFKDDENAYFDYCNKMVGEATKRLSGGMYNLKVENNTKPGHYGGFIVLFNAEDYV